MRSAWLGRLVFTLFLSVLVNLFAACNQPHRDALSDDVSTTNEAISPSEAHVFLGQNDWNQNPLADLSRHGSVSPGRGWAGHYWPSFRWGLLWRYFNQTQSPLEKFESAFETELTAANADYQRGDLAAAETVRVKGFTTSWFGICDGSSEAALSFDEPTTTKVVNGIIFYPHEIKALLSYFTALSNARRPLVFAGERVIFDSPIFDTDGRAIDSRYRDVNPGLFHLALARYLGETKLGLIVDLVSGREVLNFPVKAYRVTQQVPVTAADEIRFYKHFNHQAVEWIKVRTEVDYGESHRVLEALPGINTTLTMTYDYVLELDSHGRIIGGEWLGDSKENHPDFAWRSRESSLDLQTLTTDRLADRWLVGPAMAELLTSDDAADSSATIAVLQQHSDNLAGYRIFAGESFPPPPPNIQLLLDRAPQRPADGATY